MAHRCAEVIMPICAVQPITFMKIHYIGHFGQVIPVARHICCAVHDIYSEYASNGDIRPATGGDQETSGDLVPLHGKNCLGG